MIAQEETTLRSIPVERGGRYLLILENSAPVPAAEVERLGWAIDRLNHWLAEENTPFMGFAVSSSTTVSFERVQAAEEP